MSGGRKPIGPMTKTRHHMVPRSRLLQRHSRLHGNIKVVTRRVHDSWHTLFENRTPLEVAVMLIEQAGPPDYFTKVELVARWEGYEERYTLTGGPTAEQISWTTKQRSAWAMLFRGRDLFFVVSEVVQSWAPSGYFTRVFLEAEGHGHRLALEDPAPSVGDD